MQTNDVFTPDGGQVRTSDTTLWGAVAKHLADMTFLVIYLFYFLPQNPNKNVLKENILLLN